MDNDDDNAAEDHCESLRFLWMTSKSDVYSRRWEGYQQSSSFSLLHIRSS